jgi:hypothetical protein
LCDASESDSDESEGAPEPGTMPLPAVWIAGWSTPGADGGESVYRSLVQAAGDATDEEMIEELTNVLGLAEADTTDPVEGEAAPWVMATAAQVSPAEVDEWAAAAQRATEEAARRAQASAGEGAEVGTDMDVEAAETTSSTSSSGTSSTSSTSSSGASSCSGEDVAGVARPCV